MRNQVIRLGLVALTFTGCSSAEKKEAATADSTAAKMAAVLALPLGEAYLPVPEGKIWYHLVGVGTGTPVILLHGGPGFSSYYLKVFEGLGDDRKVIRYDQLGGGKSSGLTDTSKINIAHFVAELDSLRGHLGYDKIHILGHSWGTILGLEYYRAHPEHVASLTLASPALDIPAWEKNAKRLLKTISDSGQRAAAEAEKSGKYDTPAYKAANDEFWNKYVMRSPAQRVQADLDSTMTQINETIYNYMQGPSEFTIVGTLKYYDAVKFLKEIKVPVLFTVGEFDEANPDIVKRQAATLPGAKLEVLKGSAHMSPWDAPEQGLKVVRDFLRSVDAAKPGKT